AGAGVRTVFLDRAVAAAVAAERDWVHRAVVGPRRRARGRDPGVVDVLGRTLRAQVRHALADGILVRRDGIGVPALRQLQHRCRFLVGGLDRIDAGPGHRVVLHADPDDPVVGP